MESESPRRSEETSITVNVYNLSTTVRNDEVVLMNKACTHLLREVASSWNLRVSEMIISLMEGALPRKESVTHNDRRWTLIVADSPDQELDDATLAHYREESNRFIGFIFARSILNSGGSVVCGSSTDNAETVAAAIFRELAQMLVDSECNMWWRDRDGTLWAGDIVNPVEGVPLLLSIEGRDVMLSSFILPSWRCGATVSETRFDRQYTLSRPFRVSERGYAITITPSGERNIVWGEQYPLWKRAHRTLYCRRSAIQEKSVPEQERQNKRPRTEESSQEEIATSYIEENATVITPVNSPIQSESIEESSSQPY